MNTIACASGVDLLMEYLEGVLPAEVNAALAAFVASYQETPRILRQASAAPLPADVEASLKAFLRRATKAFKEE